jgi:hypothetical protein
VRVSLVIEHGIKIYTEMAISSVYIFVRDEEFNLSISLTKKREEVMASALARHWYCSMYFNEGNALEAFDYCLFKPTAGYCNRIEQSDDYVTSSLDSGTFFIELGIYKKKTDKTITNGKLKVTKADYYLIVLNNLKKVVLINVVNLKNLICSLEEKGDLRIYEPQDFDQWRAKHGSCPTRSALIPIQEAIHQDSDSSVLTFDELNIDATYYENLRYTRKNHDQTSDL